MTPTVFLAQAHAPAVSIGPFTLLLLALPVLLLGELLTRKNRWLLRSNVPPPIIGGLLVAILLLLAAELSPGLVALQGNTANPVWLWSVLPQWNFAAPRATDVERPLLILFFTCIGLNASWRIARAGGLPLVIYLALAAAIAAVQAATGAATAVMLHEKPLLGIMTSNVSLMGGFGTAAGFAPEFEKAGLAGAATIGVAAAAFGVIAGGVIAGMVAGRLIETKLKRGAVDAGALAAESAAAGPAPGFIGEVRELMSAAGSTVLHLGVLFACMKIGAFVSAMIQGANITFPVYMGSMLVAMVVRNLHDALNGSWLKTERIDGIGSVALMWLLAVVMIDLQLSQLAHAAVPMIVILTVQVLVLAALAYWLVFWIMGRDYEAAVMSAGMIGFGLGATSNALATMRVLARRFGPAPRAFLIVPIVGAFLIDFANALLTTTALNLLK
jgi:glutamate:Na+ symporter, ESS family